ncbi:MAG: tetratricopeptide repeat protein [Methanophagales archaeon]|nr:tetratricopeptide repeat protein [Methanophagales archaeon]
MQAEKGASKKPFEDPEMMIDVGNEYMNMKKYQRAVEIFEKIIKEEKRLTYLAKAYNGCGIAYAVLGKYEKAIENFGEAINLSRYLIDSGSRTYHNLGHVYELMGDKEKAKENFEKEKEIELDLYHYWVTMSDELE